MGVIHPGQHGSTFGGNPVAGVVATEALAVVADEKLAQNARTLAPVSARPCKNCGRKPRSARGRRLA